MFSSLKRAKEALNVEDSARVSVENPVLKRGQVAPESVEIDDGYAPKVFQSIVDEIYNKPTGIVNVEGELDRRLNDLKANMEDNMAASVKLGGFRYLKSD
jgi:hypothetical protein